MSGQNKLTRLFSKTNTILTVESRLANGRLTKKIIYKANTTYNFSVILSVSVFCPTISSDHQSQSVLPRIFFVLLQIRCNVVAADVSKTFDRVWHLCLDSKHSSYGLQQSTTIRCCPFFERPPHQKLVLG